MIEKLGHTKRIQTMRKEWIDEEKPKPFYDRTNTDDPAGSSANRNSEGDRPRDHVANNSTTNQTGTANDEDLFMPDPEAENRRPVSHPEPDDDELEDLLREQDGEITFAPPKPVPRSHQDHPEPDDDDLEDLLREQDEVMADMPKSTSRPADTPMDDFDAEYEAMNEMGL